MHPQKTRAKGTRQMRGRKQDGVGRKARDTANEGTFERRGRSLVESEVHKTGPKRYIRKGLQRRSFKCNQLSRKFGQTVRFFCASIASTLPLRHDLSVTGRNHIGD